MQAGERRVATHEAVQGIGETDRVRAVLDTGLLEQEHDPVFDRLTELAANILHVPTCLLCLVLPDRQVFASRYDADEPGVRETPIEYSYCQYVVASGEALVVRDAREHPLLADNPAIREYDAIAYLGYPLVGPDGQRLGSVCVLDSTPRDWDDHDLRMLRAFTGLVATEIQLREAQRSRAESESSTYFAAVVHELRSPMTSISGFASTLTQRWDDLHEQQRREFVQIIDEQAKRLTRFVDDLLLQSQVESGRLVARREPVRVCGVVEEAARQFPGLEVQFEGDRELEVFADRVQLEQSLVNLISNARKYGEPPIVVRAQPEEDGLAMVEVIDHGPGVPEPDQGTLFERFERGSAPTTERGSGLGLWIVRELARANAGDCSYRRAAHGGACFQLALARA